MFPPRSSPHGSLLPTPGIKPAAGPHAGRMGAAGSHRGRWLCWAEATRLQDFPGRLGLGAVLGGMLCPRGPQTITVRKSEASRGHPIAALCPGLGVKPFGVLPSQQPQHTEPRSPQHERISMGTARPPSISMAPVTMAPACLGSTG